MPDSLLCGLEVLAMIVGLIGVGLGIVEIEARIEERRRNRDRRMPVAYVRSAAIRSVREIKRQAIRELLEADRHPSASYGEVIEGTAVEVE